jgi:phage baseplate assembly protein V
MLSSPAPIPEDIPTDADLLLRIGIVLSVDLNAGRCIVQIGDAVSGATESPPIKWMAARAGRMIIWSPPVAGEQVIVAAPGGELGAAVVIGSLTSANYPNAGNDAAARIRFDNEAEIAYDIDGNILSVTLPTGGVIDMQAGSITIKAPDGVTIMGDVTVTGTIQSTGTITSNDDVIGGGKSLKTHRHAGVQSGAAQSGPPA